MASARADADAEDNLSTGKGAVRDRRRLRFGLRLRDDEGTMIRVNNVAKANNDDGPGRREKKCAKKDLPTKAEDHLSRGQEPVRWSSKVLVRSWTESEGAGRASELKKEEEGRLPD